MTLVGWLAAMCESATRSTGTWSSTSGPARETLGSFDPLHLLLQIGHKVRAERFSKLIVAAGGEAVYRLDKSDLDELAEQYSLVRSVWAFNHWPERLRKPTGERVFESWSGGMLGVLKGQMEDINEALKTWLGKAKPA